MNINYRVIPNHPKVGINFIDMDYVYRTQLKPICSDLIANMYPTEAIIAVGSRGWITASVIAYELDIPILLARDSSKGLPDWFYTEGFSNEYDERKFGISLDVIKFKSVTIVDDLIATGNTVSKIAELIKSLGITVTQILATVKLKDFNVDFNIPMYYTKEISCEES